MYLFILLFIFHSDRSYLVYSWDIMKKIFKRKVIYSNMTFSNKNSQITYVKTLFKKKYKQQDDKSASTFLCVKCPLNSVLLDVILTYRYFFHFFHGETIHFVCNISRINICTYIHGEDMANKKRQLGVPFLSQLFETNCYQFQIIS